MSLMMMFLWTACDSLVLFKASYPFVTFKLVKGFRHSLDKIDIKILYCFNLLNTYLILTLKFSNEWYMEYVSIFKHKIELKRAGNM